MTRFIDHRYLVVALAALLLSMPFLSRGLFESSEGRYAMVAKTMNESGNFWIPKLNGKDHLTKPPMTYWIIATGQKILGMNTVGSRFMHMIFWLLAVLVIVRIGELLVDKETGLIMGLIFSTALFPSLGFSFLTTDPILAALQVFSFWTLLEYKHAPRPIYAYAFWLCLGLAFSTKGPVALFPILFWVFFERKTMKAMTSPVGLSVFLVLSSFWYIGLELQTGNVLLKLFQDEIIKRSTTDFSGRNAFWWAPFVTYFIPFILGWGLWPFYLHKPLFISTIKKKENRLYLFWLIGTLIFFSMVQSRLILYILPLSLPASILLAQMLKRATLKEALIYNFLLVFVLKLTISLIPYDNNSKQISGFYKDTLGGEKLHFLNEYLYGVEFYMDKGFNRFSTHEGVFKALDNKEKIQWVAFQDKRKDIMDRILSTYHKKILLHKKQGKWNMVKIGDQLNKENAYVFKHKAQK